MAVKESFMVYTVEGDEDLQLEAKSGESLLIKDIFIYNPVNDYATIRIEKTTVGYFRVGGILGNHLSFSPTDNGKKTILGYLRDKGIFTGFPVAEGETFVIDGVAQTGAIQSVVYEKHDAGDITNVMENGSKSDNYLFINYGRSSSVNDGDNIFSSSQNPAEFPEFPFGAVVPSGHNMTLYGLLFSDVGKTSDSAGNKQVTKYLKFIKDREVMFDEKRKGIPVIGSAPTSDGINVGSGQSIVGNYSDVDYREPFMFPEPRTFISGDELNVYITTDVLTGSANISVNEIELGMIFKVSKVA
ncbi:hypothetical protein DRQ29_00320 [bacterium]|nr:MAG: hypothetical protein DRQ29_00320 [bacterium]